MHWPVNFEVKVTISADNLQQELARAHETFTALQQDMPLVSFFIHFNNHALDSSDEKMKESFALQEFQTFLKTYDVFH